MLAAKDRILRLTGQTWQSAAPDTFTNTEPHTTMTDQEKLNCLEQHGITDIIEFMEHVEHLRWRDYISDHQNERIIRLEHALLRVLCEIDRKFEQGHPISPTTHEVKTAWKMLREERMV